MQISLNAQPWNNAGQGDPKPRRAWMILAQLRGECLTVKRANCAAIQINLARLEDMLPTMTEVLPNEVLEARRRPTQ